MAGVAAGAGQSLFAAVAFSGAGYLFNMLEGGSGAKEEQRRHNLAIEKATEARERFLELKQRRAERLDEAQRGLQVARETIGSTNRSLDSYRRAKELYQGSDHTLGDEGPLLQYDGKTFDRLPTVSDFYKPSEKMVSYSILFLVILGGIIGLAAYFILT